ncbi:MAG: twin-arginine translocase TatA/TatE family subunit [Actinobacteria bacterium]|nr:MAG: twin-arginine translocase TatA/TatE family subunit [Actinomycetota bacterium]
MSIGVPELIIVLAIVLLLFGSTRLPKLARSLGQASKEFKAGSHEGAKDEPAPGADEKVTMTRAELDALLAQRDAERGKDAPPAQP